MEEDSGAEFFGHYIHYDNGLTREELTIEEFAWFWAGMGVHPYW